MLEFLSTFFHSTVYENSTSLLIQACNWVFQGSSCIYRIADAMEWLVDVIACNQKANLHGGGKIVTIRRTLQSWQFFVFALWWFRIPPLDKADVYNVE